MQRVVMWAALFALVLGGSVLAYGFAGGGAERSDCPGTVVCPLTGEEVCKDRCPLIDAARTDCPGKVECPLTGEPVCKDRCPLGEQAEAVPACCEAGK